MYAAVGLWARGAEHWVYVAPILLLTCMLCTSTENVDTINCIGTKSQGGSPSVLCEVRGCVLR